jgi:DNA-binding transcriptional ArsR family regulator
MSSMRRDVFQAIADPKRRAIIGLLATQKLTINSVAEHFPISRPAISKHIKILTECGLVVVHRQGREKLCEARLDKLSEVSTWVEHYQTVWEQRFDRLDEYLNEMQKKEKDHGGK